MIFKSLKWKDNFFQVFWSIFCRFSQFLLCYFFTSCTIISALFLSIAIKIKLNACVFHFQNCHSNQLNLIERCENCEGAKKTFLLWIEILKFLAHSYCRLFLCRNFTTPSFGRDTVGQNLKFGAKVDKHAGLNSSEQKIITILRSLVWNVSISRIILAHMTSFCLLCWVFSFNKAKFALQ